MSEKGQRHMVMPTKPGPGLVMIHPQFALGFLNRSLDRPARACQPHQFGVNGRGRSVAQIILDLARIARAVAKDEPDIVARTATAFAHGADESEISGDRSFGAPLDRVAFSVLRREVGSNQPRLLSRRFTFGRTRLRARTARLNITGLALARRQNLRLTKPDRGIDLHLAKYYLSNLSMPTRNAGGIP
jgi:hypothetical protein